MTNEPDSTTSQVRPIGKRLWIKLLLVYLLPACLIVIGTGWLAYRAARNAMEQQLGEALTAVARTAAGMLARPRAIGLRPSDEETRTYRNLKEKLAELKGATRVARIILFDRHERALVDSEGSFAIGETIAHLAANRTELQDVLSGADRSSVLFTGQDGHLYKTGYAPVYLDGDVVAIVGVDGSATFFGPLSDLGRTLALVGLFAVILVLLVTLLLSRRITRPLDRLAKAARAIGRGELEAEIRVETGDEIGVLANTLNEMRQSISARDRQMQMMLSGIAHEVRNPLGGMTLFVGLLEEELPSEATSRKHVKRIASELDYLARVVNDFLDFARKKPAAQDLVDPRMEFEQIRALCSDGLAERNVKLDIRVASEITKTHWDQERMRRAVLNLVRNAIQASEPNDEIVISLTTDQGGGVSISVADEGRGIPEDKLDRIFEPFFTTREKGTGLGLALVHKTIESHGGDIAVSSAVDKGTTFTISLPAGKAVSHLEAE